MVLTKVKIVQHENKSTYSCLIIFFNSLIFAQCPNPVPAGKTCVPDDNFEAYLESQNWGDGIANNDLVDTSKINGITTLFANFKSIANLQGIEDFTALQVLYCNVNVLTSLDLSNNFNLQQLYCNNNQINSLTLPNSTNLQHIECFNNMLSELNVSNNPNLATLFCWSNPLNGLNLENNLALTTLDCHNSGLTSLDVTNNTALLALRSEQNLLSSIDLSNNTSLLEINLNFNMLSELDVSTTSQLASLSCNLNGLQQLNLKNGHNDVLNTLNATDNSLSCVQVDNITDAENKVSWNFDAGVYFDTNCPGLSTDEFDFEHIILYPNPTYSVLNIQLDLEANYRLHDLKGGLFLNGNFDSGTNELNLSSLSNGVYVLYIENNQSSIAQKIIKY